MGNTVGSKAFFKCSNFYVGKNFCFIFEETLQRKNLDSIKVFSVKLAP